MLTANEVVFTIGGNPILDHVSLSVEKGSFFGLFGPDDAGKTMLLSLLCGFYEPQEGQVELLGQNPFLDSPGNGIFRFVPDDIILESSLRGCDYLKFCRMSSIKYKEEIEEGLCIFFDLPINRKLLEMTYTENKMIQIIGAVSAMPELLILDEPKNFLDKETYRKLLNSLEVFRGNGMTILIAAESYEDVQSHCTHYAYIREGKVAASAKVPRSDSRKKMVIVNEPSDETLAKKLLSVMEKQIAVQRGRAYYLFSGDPKLLCGGVLLAACKELVVEELTLEEELNEDYSRWI